MNVNLPTIETKTPIVETFSWTDYNPLTALKLATEDKKSFCITAPPGCGKTCLVNQVVDKLKELGEKYICIAKTHVAVSLSYKSQDVP